MKYFMVALQYSTVISAFKFVTIHSIVRDRHYFIDSYRSTEDGREEQVQGNSGIPGIKLCSFAVW